MAKPLPPRVAIIRGPSDGLTAEMFRGIARYVREHREWDFYSDHDPMFKPLPPLRRWRGDGILCFVRTAAPAREVFASGLPAVNVSSTCRDLFIPQVISDNPLAGRLAAESLLTTGLHQFGFVGMKGVGWSDDRRAGFTAAVAACGKPLSVFDPPRKLQRFFLRTSSRRDWRQLRPYLCRWIKSLELPVGIMACNDVTGRHVIEACHELGLKVPEQVAIIGVDNEVMRCELCIPPLSSVDTDQQRIGYEAAALLDRLMAGDRKPDSPVIVPPKGVVVRQSSDTLAVKDQEVCLALGMIRESAGVGITVERIVQNAGIARRMLEIRTRAAIGRSLQQEISRTRKDRIVHLLTHTDLSLRRISASVGFSSVARMAAFFKKHSGMTLSECRKRHSTRTSQAFPVT